MQDEDETDLRPVEPEADEGAAVGAGGIRPEAVSPDLPDRQAPSEEEGGKEALVPVLIPDNVFERMAKAAYEGQRARYNPTEKNAAYHLLPWEDEPEALRMDWRMFIADALEELREPGDEVIEEGVGAPISLVHLDSERDRKHLTMKTQLQAIVSAIAVMAPPRPSPPVVLEPIADEEEAVG